MSFVLTALIFAAAQPLPSALTPAFPLAFPLAIPLAIPTAPVANAASALAPRSAQAKATDDKQKRDLTIFAEHIYSSPGHSTDKGMLVTSGTKISLVSVGGDNDSESDKAIKCFAITPGLIDASAHIASDPRTVEQSRETTPEVRVASTLDVFDNAWEREVKSGVTTVLINPPDQNVIGGLGVVLKTAGKNSISERTLKADAVLRGAMGSQPSEGNHSAFGRPTDFFSRRPTTRMGVEWEWRNAFYEAGKVVRGVVPAFPGSAELVRVLKGDLTLSIQAWTTQDIRTAVFLREEIEDPKNTIGGHPRLFLDAAAEAWKEPQLLVRSKTAVVLPPFPPNGRTGEGAFMAWNVAKLLVDEGVLVALSSHGATGLADRLSVQAGYAMQGGLSFDQALATVTINPAHLLGVEDRVGSLGVGKDADFVLWSGPPFEPSSRIIGVVVDGALVVDPRTKK